MGPDAPQTEHHGSRCRASRNAISCPRTSVSVADMPATKGRSWPTPTYSHRHGESHAGMRDSLADAAIAPRAILLVVYREARGPSAQGGWHAKRRLQGDHHRLLQQRAQVYVHILYKIGANSWREHSAQTVMGSPQEDQASPGQPARYVQELLIRLRRVPEGHVMAPLTSPSPPRYVHAMPRQRAPNPPDLHPSRG